jgi:hypothetical protein
VHSVSAGSPSLLTCQERIIVDEPDDVGSGEAVGQLVGAHGASPYPAPIQAEAMSPNFGADDDADLQAALLASMTEMSPAADMDFSTLNPSSPLFAQFERPPLVANPEPIEPWAATQIRTRDEAVQALRRLSECGTLLVRIRGDGHCLFRALAAGLVLAVREMEPARARSVGAWLHPRLARAPPATSSNLNDANLAGSVTSASGAALDLLGALHEGTLPSIASEAIFAGLAEQQSSDELVIAMRRAACGHLARHAGRFRECEAALGVSFETYLGDMAELHPTDGAPRYGSALEVVALAELLECVIDIYDCDTLKVVALAGRDCAPDVPPSYRFFPERDDTPGDEWRGESAGEGSAPSMDGALQSWVLVDPPSELPDALERVAEPSPLRRTGLALLRTGLHYHLLHPIGCNFESEIGRVGER